jgi:glutamine amidotransferase
LALTLGLEQDPIGALERTVGFIEELARQRGIEDPVQASFGVSDGESLWAVRYASGGSARSLFISADPETIRRLHPENPRFARLTPDDRVVVSEPFSDLPGVWEPVPEATAVTVHRGGVLEMKPFAPRVDEPA